MRHITKTLALLALIIIAGAPAMAQISWPTIGESCMPMTGKMKPVRNWATRSDISPTPACHCPPTSFCPTTLADWEAQTKMPGGITQVCCSKPAEMVCVTEHLYHSGTFCPSYVTTGPEETNFCMHYKPSTDGSPDAAETDLRKKVADTINSCLSGVVASLNASTTTSPRGDKSRNMNQFLDFVTKEMSCRLAAATELKIPLSKIDKSFFNSTELISKRQSYFIGGYTYAVLPRRMHDLLTFQFDKSYTKWMGSSAGGPRLKDFTAKFPAASIVAGQGLEGKLTCDDVDQSSVCYSAMLNNGSCSSCLAPGTLVELADGTKKIIELIGAGDRVKGQTSENIVQELVALDWKDLVMYKINGALLQLTADHPLMTTTGWRAINFTPEAMEKYGIDKVDELRVGDVLITRDGEVKIETIEALPPVEKQRTYNLKMKGDGTFYANGVVVKDNVNVD